MQWDNPKNRLALGTIGYCWLLAQWDIPTTLLPLDTMGHSTKKGARWCQDPVDQ